MDVNLFLHSRVLSVYMMVLFMLYYVLFILALEFKFTTGQTVLASLARGANYHFSPIFCLFIFWCFDSLKIMTQLL